MKRSHPGFTYSSDDTKQKDYGYWVSLTDAVSGFTRKISMDNKLVAYINPDSAVPKTTG